MLLITSVDQLTSSIVNLNNHSVSAIYDQCVSFHNNFGISNYRSHSTELLVFNLVKFLPIIRDHIQLNGFLWHK